jgi:hypothetical protein
MYWQSRFLRALLARIHPVAIPAPAGTSPDMKSAAHRHTAPGFGTLVIGHAPRDWPGAR